MLRTLGLALTTLLLPPGPATASEPTVHITAAHELPGDQVYPEGIATDPRSGDLYAGSFEDGTVFKMTRGHRKAEIFLPAGADGRDTANGLKVDAAGRLWVADSTTGISVYDTRDGRLIAQFDVPGDDPRFINDLAITPDGTAYITDSIRSVLYRVTPRQLAQGSGMLNQYADLSDDLDPYEPGTFTINGIVADPTGRYLLVADMEGGDLFRVDLGSGSVRRVTLYGGAMRHADGLELQHGKLWVVHNVIDGLSRWRVSRNGRVAYEQQRVIDERLQLPTTLVRRDGRLYVARSQFDEGGPMGPGEPEIPFTIAAVTGL